ncbi:histone H1A, sperm-like [Leptopilina heterotoma]|uniref:histone H1A, sperm-like n=1 Tax=Leptopilina heterotoma TaxID=63436 RepID=UPI001CA935BF|nr:histone H1A, sperm-like [Leptopilina heterotoma]XP_043474913.1 histone H1A, sperm-like [Leptopilina heterotoma]XP_043474914.1 histone H1A, sperm-like [Leptopilina heterotoma]XP_043481836.1 histone H1A, sperm-like [Leptopilina heterotoma]
MAEKAESTVAPAVAPSEGAAKSKQPRVKAAHPPASEMVVAAITHLNEKGGSSLQAIKKFIAGKYVVDVERQATFIRKYLKAAVANKTLIQTKGTGAAGSFKLNVAKSEGKAKPKAPKAKKPAVAEKKKPAKVAAKPPKAKSTAAKPKVTKASPKKSKAPAAAKKASPKPRKTAVKKVAKQ